MQCSVVLLCFSLLPSFVSLAGQTQKNQERERFFRVPSAVILPVVAYQRDCPIEFVKASILDHVGGGGVETFQIRNRGTKPIRAYNIATVTSVGSGAEWRFQARRPSEWLMPDQVLPPSIETSIEVVPITNDMIDEYKLRGPMKGITVFMVVVVEYSDGSIYDAEVDYKALQDFFVRNRITPH
jgi:hypothetical protein